MPSSSSFCAPQYGTIESLIADGLRVTSGPYASEALAADNCECDGGGIDAACGQIIFPHWAIDQGGAAAGDYYFNTTPTVARGRSLRLSDTKYAYLRADIGKMKFDESASQEMIAFNMAMGGKLRRFLYRWSRACRLNMELIGTGNGVATQFQLIKTMQYQCADPYIRTIKYPSHGYPPLYSYNCHDEPPIYPTQYLRIYKNGVESHGWDADRCTGLVTFDSAPAVGAQIRATCEYFHSVISNKDGIPLEYKGNGFYESAEGLELVEPVGSI